MSNIAHRFHIAGICETNADEEVLDIWKAAKEDNKMRYRVISAEPPKERGPGAGMALVIRKNINIKDEEVIYKDPEGKALVVNMEVEGIKADTKRRNNCEMHANNRKIR